jgi:hypothetical protein
MLNTSVDLSGRPLTGSPVDLRRFVDRKQELDRTWQSLARRANVLVVGQRGAGKTSFLRKLEAEIGKTDALGDAVYVDGSAAGSVDELLSMIAWRLGLAPPAADSAGFGGHGAVGVIERLRSLGPEVESPLPTAILLDEPPPDVAHTLFGRLRDEVWQLPYTWAVAVDAVDRSRVLQAPADAFFGSVVELGELEPADALALLRNRVGTELATAELEQLVELGGGNPRRLIALAREALIDGVPVSRLATGARRRENALDGLSDSARRVAAFLEDAGPRSASDSDLLTHFGWTRNRAVQVLNELADAGVVTSSIEKGGRRKLYELASVT